MVLSDELAQLAARHIAEEGLTYFEAKRKAAKQVGVAEHSAAMPSNTAIEQALRDYQAEYMSDTQPIELFRLRTIALDWLNQLNRLSELNGRYLTLVVGAVVNGTAGEHSPIHLQVYTDDFKGFEITLLNEGIALEFTEKRLDNIYYPVLVAQDQGVPVVMTVLPRARHAVHAVGGENDRPQHATGVQLGLMMKHTYFGVKQ
jgi:hypothetical protein